MLKTNTILNFTFVKIKNFFSEINSQNSNISAFKIEKIKKRNNITYFKVQTGGPFNVTIKAASIINNLELFERFNYEDKSLIVIESGICEYKITDISLETKFYLVTVSAKFNNTVFCKKYTPQELSSMKNLFQKISFREQNYISDLINKSKLIPFFASSENLVRMHQ